MVANSGLLYVKQRSRPTDYIITILGSNSVSNDNWALLTFQDGMVKDTREMLMPDLMNSMRLPDFIALCRHSLLWPTTFSVSVTLCVSAYAFLVLTYEKRRVKFGNLRCTSPQPSDYSINVTVT